MTQICTPFFSKKSIAALAILLASFIVSPALAWAPRHVTQVNCPPAYVALVYYHGSYYHRDAWVEWANYKHLDFSQAQVYLFPAQDFDHGIYIGPGAYPFSKEFFYSHKHAMHRLHFVH